MYNIIALIGESGAGKDSILNEVLSRNFDFHEIISHTTRPPRENEIDGVNYHYCSSSEFKAKLLNGEMIEYTKFNEWYYGTSLEAIAKNEINIGVFNPEGVRCLIAHPKCNVCVFWIKVSDKNRLMRQLLREENPNVKEIIRRYSTDVNDFREINFNYKEILNNTLTEYEEGINEIIKCAQSYFAIGQK